MNKHSHNVGQWLLDYTPTKEHPYPKALDNMSFKLDSLSAYKGIVRVSGSTCKGKLRIKATTDGEYRSGINYEADKGLQLKDMDWSTVEIWVTKRDGTVEHESFDSADHNFNWANPMALELDTSREENQMTEEKKVLNLIKDYGGIDGAHHKQWLLDQLVRAITVHPEAYAEWVADYEAGEDGPDTYSWDEGIAP